MRRTIRPDHGDLGRERVRTAERRRIVMSLAPETDRAPLRGEAGAL